MAPLLAAIPATTAQVQLLATIVGTAGILQQGVAAEAQAESQQNIATYNALVQKREAEARRQRGAFAQKRQAKKAAEIESVLIARLGAAGGLGSPVAADLAAEQAAELELENLLIGYEAEVGAERALSQARLDKLQGKVFRQRGKQQKTASQIGAGTTLLMGFA